MDNGVMVFQPQFPLEPGVTYRAEFKVFKESATGLFTIPKLAAQPSTHIERVYPTTSTLPENQLKLYIHFSAPMSRGEAYRRIHLIDDKGVVVALPFVEIDEELWDREYRRLTVLFDPGRIKRDLVPNREVGPPLNQGRRYALVIDRDWPDAKGVPLVSGYRKEFDVGPPDRTPLDIKTWRIHAPAPGAAAPLEIEFPEPIDAALLYRFIDVVNEKGEALDGSVTLDREETVWRFVPSRVWAAGAYRLEVVSTLEDLAGNKIGRTFDVDTFDTVQQQITAGSHSVPFTVQASR
jgi:hypothetical protein